MPIIFDVLYREFCRARLAEMRKQLLLWPGTPVVPEERLPRRRCWVRAEMGQSRRKKSFLSFAK
jgi:hypothetical protein